MKTISNARKQAVQSIEQRNMLVQANTGLVYFLAKRLYSTLADDADLDELVSAGMLGLIRAAELFEHHRGLAFTTFASTRIRGAMLDELRRLDRLPRSLRAKDRQLQTVRSQVELFRVRNNGNLPADFNDLMTPPNGEDPYLQKTPTLPTGYEFMWGDNAGTTNVETIYVTFTGGTLPEGLTLAEIESW